MVETIDMIMIKIILTVIALLAATPSAKACGAREIEFTYDGQTFTISKDSEHTVGMTARGEPVRFDGRYTVTIGTKKFHLEKSRGGCAARLHEAK